MTESQGEAAVPAAAGAGDFSWELIKENAQPLKRGRDTKKLARALTARSAPDGSGSAGTKEDLTSKVAKFEASIAPEALAEAPDPLGVWIRYINWAREANPTGTGLSAAGGCGMIELMERCTRALTHDPRFRNDERFIKVGTKKMLRATKKFI